MTSTTLFYTHLKTLVVTNTDNHSQIPTHYSHKKSQILTNTQNPKKHIQTLTNTHKLFTNTLTKQK